MDSYFVPPALIVTSVAAGFYIKIGFLSEATPCPVGKTSVANYDASQADGGISCSIKCSDNCLNCN